MKQEAAAKTTHSPSVDRTAVLGSIGTDLLDTTWRIAVPVVFFAVGGIIADRHFHTAPWITLMATVFGFIIAGLLLKRQLAALEKRDRA
jgi:F0F1-type ATP synthase assembly protein I